MIIFQEKSSKILHIADDIIKFEKGTILKKEKEEEGGESFWHHLGDTSSDKNDGCLGCPLHDE